MKDYILNLIKNIPDREIPITLDIVMEGGAYNGYYGLGSLLLIKELEKNGVTPRNGLVCLAGFMRIISPHFIKKYKNRIFNIHPALLPAYPGLNAQKQAIQNGAKVSGCTVHFVDEGVDSGPIILQSVVKVRNNDNEKTLSKRILIEEHKIYPEAVKLFARKKIRLSGKRAIILD